VTGQGLKIRTELIELKNSIESFILSGIEKDRLEIIEQTLSEITEKCVIPDYEKYIKRHHNEGA